MEWTKYTTKEALKDNDELMILDKDANANKRTLMDKIWNYVVDKMTTAVIAKLGTTNKTLIGAVNELNSNLLDIEYGTGKITSESNRITFKKNHTKIPTSICLTYMEIGISIPGEPKELKPSNVSSNGFVVALSSFDGTERSFSWIAIW